MRKVEGGYMVPYTIAVVDGSTGHRTLVTKEAYVSNERMQDAIDLISRGSLWSRFKSVMSRQKILSKVKTWIT